MAPAYTILPYRNVPTCGGKLEPTVMIRGGGNNTPCVHHCVPGPPPPPQSLLAPPFSPSTGGLSGRSKTTTRYPTKVVIQYRQRQLTEGFENKFTWRPPSPTPYLGSDPLVNVALALGPPTRCPLCLVSLASIQPLTSLLGPGSDF